MKKIFPFLVFLLVFGCREENRIEVIPNYDDIYVPLSKIDIAPQLIEGDELELAEKINEMQKSSGNKITAHYKLYLNESGKVDKIQNISGDDKKLQDLITESLKNWKFKPGMLDNKAVKSQYHWKFTSDTATNKIIFDEEYLLAADEMPQPVGGIQALQEKIVYPELAQKAGIEGKVFIRAFIDEQGNVVATRVIKGIGSGLDEAAVNAIRQTKFTPAKHNGKTVKVQVAIPIVFKLK